MLLNRIYIIQFFLNQFFIYVFNILIAALFPLKFMQTDSYKLELVSLLFFCLFATIVVEKDDFLLFPPIVIYALIHIYQYDKTKLIGFLKKHTLKIIAFVIYLSRYWSTVEQFQI
jgi:hypothetical protein